MNELLGRTDVVEHRIVSLHMTDQRLENDLKCTTTYFTLDHGISFVIPLSFVSFLRCEVPWTAEKLDGTVVGKICSSPIKSVHVLIDEAGEASDETVIELESGTCIYDVMVAPVGVPTGVFIMSPDKIDRSRYRDYWFWQAEHPSPKSASRT
jgi:hypothetical protein